jgi:CheY-like chemotaxis protein
MADLTLARDIRLFGGGTNVSSSASCDLHLAISLRCLIVDHNARFRAELLGLLEEQGIDVVGSAAYGDEAVQKVAELRPDVALVDIDLGRESGFDLARRWRDGADDVAPTSS